LLVRQLYMTFGKALCAATADSDAITGALWFPSSTLVIVQISVYHRSRELEHQCRLPDVRNIA
jgi:hypothetical protein